MKHLGLYKRAVLDLWRSGKRYYLLLLIQTFARASQTFVSFIFMNRLITLLSEQNLVAVRSVVSLYLIIFTVLHLLTTLLQPAINDAKELADRRILELPYEKMLTMRYHIVDSAETSQKLERIRMSNMSRQSSLYLINVRIPFLMDYFIRVVWSFILLIPLFTQVRVTGQSQWDWVSSPWVLLIFVIGIVLSIYIQYLSSQKSAEYMSNLDESVIRTNTKFNYENRILENTESGKEIRLYQMQDRLYQNQKELDQSTEKLLRGLNHAGMNGHLLTVVVSQLLHFVAYAIIGIRVLLGMLPIGQIVQLSSALTQLLSNLPNLIQYLAMILSQPDTLVEYYAFIDLPDDQDVGSLPIEKRLDNEYHIAVNQLSFAYPETDDLILNNVSAKFEVGKKYAIVGENGSGKTTFIKLLMRLYEPTAGEITLNKIDAQKYQLSEYFQLFSVVFQDFRLLSFKLGQNIAVNQNYDTDKAMKYIRQLDLEQMVSQLPAGLETYLGKEFSNQGVNLSGGQEQRVALVRALYKNAPIMILDEPTAALDPVTEFNIYQQFDQLINHKTAFYISHRLSSCRFCDEILVFDKGEIIQRGSHDELVKIDGKYADLWHAQAQYYQ
ncbi:ABC transporter ATP-binding protein [Fundicoccus culcitae]|uniref:ABC transporter ATP-binding protein/permease n=1 Tax=Fundicoccus culcitae TaxID=2969821 RepID=A0ABY5P6E2_9LACT|nr:ABC transporter ATP-binding protein [Fundicoccus culcitae]UUX34249.1 ABC transporter ATP-binding protein/permease [Fundicoccus culcitae]